MGKLRYFRQLPRLLQVLWLAGILLLLVGIVTLTSEILTATSAFVVFLNSPQASSPAGPPLGLMGTGMSLAMLGVGCAWPTNMYIAHLRRPGRAPWPDTWQMQMLAALALAALPLCSLALTLLMSPADMPLTMMLFVGIAALNVIEAFLLFAANIWSFAVALR